MKKLPYLIILLLFPTLLLAQSEKSYVINAGGGSVKSGNIAVTYFIGDFIGLGSTNLKTEIGNIEVYPNPVISTLYLKTEISDLNKIQLFNLNGILLFETRLVNNEVNFSLYPTGVYLIKFYDKNETEVGSVKVIKR